MLLYLTIGVLAKGSPLYNFIGNRALAREPCFHLRLESIFFDKLGDGG